MVAIGLAINKIVSLHRCNCGRQYEQWNDQPTPPCPDCEKTRPSKASNRKRVIQDVETPGKRAKLEERTEERQIAPMQDPSPHSLLEPTPNLNNHTLGVAPTIPPPARSHPPGYARATTFPENREKGNDKFFPTVICTGIVQHREHMLPECYDPVPWGHR